MAPTLAGYYETTNWATSTNNNTVYTVPNVVVQTGDILTVFGALEVGGNSWSAGPAGNGLTYTERQKPNADNDASHADTQLWTATATGNATFDITATKAGASTCAGLAVFVWRNAVLGTPVTAGNEDAGTAPSLAITTAAANSAVAFMSVDWNAADGTTRTWRTINSITPTSGNGLEKRYARNSASYTVYVGYWNDVGATGSKTTGLSAPTGQEPNAVAIEIQGSGATDATVSATAIAAVAAQPAPTKQTGSTVAATAIATVAALPAPTVTAVTAVSPATVAALAALSAPNLQTGSVVAANAIITTIALPPPTVTAVTAVSPATVAATTSLPAPAVQTGSTVTAVAIAATTALPAPTVSTAGNATVEPATIATVATLGAPSLSTGSVVAGVAIATAAALPAPTVDTGASGTYSSHVTLAAARNGTTAHTVHSDGTGGSVVDGSTFTPTSGRLLVALGHGAVTFTTPTGWTLPSGGSAVGNSGLYLFYRTADGTSADEIATTHNGSNYPVVVDFYEFPTGTTFLEVDSTAGATNGSAGPDLTGLTGTNWTAGVAGQGNGGGTTGSYTWDAGTEEVDTSEAASGTDGYSYSLTYTANDASSTVSYTATCSLAGTLERLVFALDVPAGGATDATVEAVVIAAVGTLPAPAVQTGSTVAPAVVATIAALPAPAVSASGNATITAVAISAVAALPAPAVTAGVIVTPAAIAAVVEIPDVEQAHATVAPATVAAVAAVPAPTVQTAGNATVAATSIAAIAALPAPTVQTAGNATVTASSVAAVASLPAPAVSTGATVTATTVATATALPAPSIQTAGNVTIPATAVATVTSLPTPGLQTGSRVNPATIATVTSITAPTVSGNTTVSPASIATVATLPAPGVRCGSTVTPGTLATVTALPKPAASGNVVQSLAARSSTGPRLFRGSTGHQLFRSSADLG